MDGRKKYLMKDVNCIRNVTGSKQCPVI